MRAIYMLPLLALAACNLSGDAQAQQGQGQQGQTDRSYNVGAFNGVGLAGRHNVIVTQGPEHSVRASGTAAVLDRLEIKVERGVLKIGEQRQRNMLRFRNAPAATIYVTAPAIETAAIAGSGDMRIDRVQGSRFKASIAGSGDMHVGALQVNEAEVSVAGSGDVRASGTAGNAKISIAGSGDVDLREVQSRTANISIMGSGDVKLRATETAAVSVMGSGDVSVHGPARCTISKRGSGTVRCNL